MGVALFENLVKIGITATGTLTIDRKGVPDVKQLQKALSASNALRGDGYFCVCVVVRQIVGRVTWSS